jgi:hypothetical protein
MVIAAGVIRVVLRPDITVIGGPNVRFAPKADITAAHQAY